MWKMGEDWAKLRKKSLKIFEKWKKIQRKWVKIDLKYKKAVSWINKWIKNYWKLHKNG